MTEVIVVGAGIGGLSLALSLHQAAIPVRVYDAVRDLAPLGVGINLQPTAVRELTELGFADALAGTGNAVGQLSYLNRHGQVVWSEPRGTAAGYHWPQYAIHRGRLQALLLAATRQRIGAGNVRTGLRLNAFHQDSRKVTASFIEASGATVCDEADILVGADGIHSTVRRYFYPDEGLPRFAGQILWRAAIEAEEFLGGHHMVVAGHFRQRAILYPIGPGSKPGRLLTNWLCQIAVADDAPPREDWNRRVSRETVLASFGQWRFPWLDLPTLVERTPNIFEFPLVDRDPVERWSFGRVTLIGDAAHPMQPIGSQAGSQAIIDARALTAALLSTRDPVEALQHYDHARRPAMNEITLRNRQFGPEAALQLAEERAPDGFKSIDDVIPRAELEAITASFASAAGLGVEAVNGRPSFVEVPPPLSRRLSG
jgi:2-polyprenyl-6-methoxyphenol hydroxylase-like FAD-dependent oxidoreductase